jgi:hypothetical protein
MRYDKRMNAMECPMEIYDYESNCSMVALHQVAPDRTEAQIVKACLKAGFPEGGGMLPHEIHKAMRLLKLQFTSISPRVKGSRYEPGDLRGNMTLHQALEATRDHVCLIRVSGHVLASNRGTPLDPNGVNRGARRRVLEICVIHNATIAERDATAICDDPLIVFDRDLRDETQKTSARMKLYHKIFANNVTDTPIPFSELRKLGYTRKMMLRHFSRGEVHIIKR